MNNLFFDAFPDAVEVEGKMYPIVTDFREWIRFLNLIEDEDVPWESKAILMFQWYRREIPQDLEKAIYALGDFLAAKVFYQHMDTNEEKTFEPAFSFDEDAGCIYAAFRECYGIDLQTVDYMHWWKFKTLFDWLPEKTEIKQRMLYRTIDLNSISDKEERKRVKKIKDMVALKKKKGYVSDYDIGDAFA